MADETKVGNPGQDDGGGDASTPTPEQIKEARRSFLDKIEVEFARSAGGGNQRVEESGDDDSGDEAIDLSGLDPQVAKEIRRRLTLAERKGKHVGTLAQFGIEKARRAKALELGREFQLDDDEVSRVEKALSSARTPDDVDLAGRELAIKFREDGSVMVVKPATKPKTKDDSGDGTTPPPVDQGRGGGTNRAAALVAKIDEINPYGDPAEAEKQLEATRAEMEAAQKRFMERAARR